MFKKRKYIKFKRIPNLFLGEVMRRSECGSLDLGSGGKIDRSGGFRMAQDHRDALAVQWRVVDFVLLSALKVRRVDRQIRSAVRGYGRIGLAQYTERHGVVSPAGNFSL